MGNGDGTATLAGVPTETGDFPVELTVRQVLDPSQKDTKSFTISVAKAAATVTLSNLSVTYTGTAHAATATTTPGGLTVDVTYNGSSTPPTNAGSYAVVATINDQNYAGSAGVHLTLIRQH